MSSSRTFWRFIVLFPLLGTAHVLSSEDEKAKFIVNINMYNSKLLDIWQCWSIRVGATAAPIFIPGDETTARAIISQAHRASGTTLSSEYEITRRSHTRIPRTFGGPRTAAGFKVALAQLRAGFKAVITSVEIILLSNPLKSGNDQCWMTTDSDFKLVVLRPTERAEAFVANTLTCLNSKHGSILHHCLVSASQAIADTYHEPPCTLQQMVVNFHSLFVLRSAQRRGRFPGFLDVKSLDYDRVHATLKAWSLWHDETLPCKRIESDSCPFTGQRDVFHMTIRILTMNRVDSLRRAVNSLKKADFGGDSVTLEVWVDRPRLDKDLQGHAAVVKYVTYGLKWPHGSLDTHILQESSGIVKQWVRRVNVSPSGVVLIFEDDLEAAPLFYTWAKQAISFYYFNCSNFDSHNMGLSLEREHEFLGQGRLFWLAEKYPDLVTKAHSGSGAVYATQKDSSWGPVVFPGAWNRFVDWYWTVGHLIKEPCVYGLVSNKWMRDTVGDIWTPWLHRYIFDTGSYFLYFNYGIYNHKWLPNALVRNHREAGIHFQQVAKARHRWQPFVEHPPVEADFKPIDQIVFTDFYHRRVEDRHSLVDRWRLVSQITNRCHFFS